MNLDNGLVSSIVYGNKEQYLNCKTSGIKADFLQGKWQEVFRFVEKYIGEYDSIPTPNIIAEKLNIDIEKPLEPIDFYRDEVIKRALFERLKSGLQGCVGKLNEKEPDAWGAFNALNEVVKNIREDGIRSTKIENLLLLGDSVIQEYLKAKEGKIGISSPWSGLNAMTAGWRPGDFAIFVARPSIGKTHCLILCARQVWMDKKKVLFICTEMPKIKIAMRFFSIHLKVPYSDLRDGRLGFSEEKVFDEIRKLQEENEFYIVGDDFNVDINNIDEAIYNIKPDIVFIDGIYLVSVPGKNRLERVSNVADEMKRMARRYGIPIVVTHQFNRQAKTEKEETAALDNLYQSDVLGMDSDYVFALVQTKKMLDDNRMEIKALKVREGQKKDNVKLNWDFQHCNFEEEMTGDYIYEENEGIEKDLDF